MSQPGIGAMLGHLSGNADTVAAYHRAIGQPIVSARIDPDANGGDGACTITFASGGTLTVADDGRSCCESRYITCDDDLANFEGAVLRSIELREGPEVEAEYDCHETQFVVAETDRGSFTLCTHNEHNGYYGGFWITLSYADPAAQPSPGA